MAASADKLTTAFDQHRAGNLPEAERLCREVLQQQPANAAAWSLLGMLAHQVGQHDAAARCLECAVQLSPGDAQAQRNLGIVWQHLRRDSDAEKCFRHLVELRPVNAEGHTLLGAALVAQDRLEEAVACFRRAVDLEPRSADGLNHLGTTLADLGKTTEAVDCFQRALELRPTDANLHTNLGATFTELFRFDEAIACHRRAIELQPDMAEAHSNLGNALEKQGQLDDAVACYRRALELRPDLPEAEVNLGNALTELAAFSQAESAYRRALRLRPDYADAHAGLGSLLLLLGQLAPGWREYEWRWGRKRFPQRRYSQPLWEGGNLASKTILLHAEQGFGDTFQFVRYVPLVKKLGATVVLAVPTPLLKILAHLPGCDALIAKDVEPPPFDLHAPLLSLPRIFQTTLETIPNHVPYLFADHSLVELWRQPLAGAGGLRIGINWHGRAGHGAHRLRDIPFECLAALADLPQISLVTLQKGEPWPAGAAASGSVIDVSQEIDRDHGPFMDTAAIMMNLDLVITSDTSVAHLAGALGVPVWVALPFVPNWRWLIDRTDSPWYPTMRLFRQKSPGDWTGVFQQITAALPGLSPSRR